VATFVDRERASFEPRPRLYFFDPNHGCYYSDDETDFLIQYRALEKEHSKHNRGFSQNWYVLEVFNPDDEVRGWEVDASPLFA